MIIVDAREQALIAELTNTGKPFAICNLPLGDISIKEDDEVTVLLERKTYSDLAASLKDKRYREQLNRFRASAVHMKGYILEGSLPIGAIGGIPVSTIDSMILGLIFRDGLIVLYSRNTNHTAELILKLQAKLIEYREDILEGKDIRDSLIGLSNVKKENMTPEICYLSQLAQLPQISTVSAKALAERFPNMPSLISFIQNDRNALYELSNIKVSDRRLGKSIASGIIKYLMFENSSPELKESKIKISIKPKVQSQGTL